MHSQRQFEETISITHSKISIDFTLTGGTIEYSNIARFNKLLFEFPRQTIGF